MNNFITIGTIVNTQGVKGDMRVVPATHDITRFELLEHIYLENPKDKNLTQHKIEKVWYHKNFVILKLEGIKDMTEAERLKTFVIKIPESEKLPLEDDEYYIGDMYDIEVFDENNNLLGVISDILTTGSNDVYVVHSKEKGDLLLPAIKACIKNVDIKSKRMIAHVLDGLEWQ